MGLSTTARANSAWLGPGDPFLKEMADGQVCPLGSQHSVASLGLKTTSHCKAACAIPAASCFKPASALYLVMESSVAGDCWLIWRVALAARKGLSCPKFTSVQTCCQHNSECVFSPKYVERLCQPSLQLYFPLFTKKWRQRVPSHWIFSLAGGEGKVLMKCFSAVPSLVQQQNLGKELVYLRSFDQFCTLDTNKKVCYPPGPQGPRLIPAS